MTTATPLDTQHCRQHNLIRVTMLTAAVLLTGFLQSPSAHAQGWLDQFIAQNEREMAQLEGIVQQVTRDARPESRRYGAYLDGLKQACFFQGNGQACDELTQRLRQSSAQLDVNSRQIDARRGWQQTMRDIDQRRASEWRLYAQGQRDSWAAEIQNALRRGDLRGANQALGQVQHWDRQLGGRR